MSIKTLVSTTILVLLLGACSDPDTKIQATIPKANICVQKEGAGFEICPNNSPDRGDVVSVSHKIKF